MQLQFLQNCRNFARRRAPIGLSTSYALRPCLGCARAAHWAAHRLYRTTLFLNAEYTFSSVKDSADRKLLLLLPGCPFPAAPLPAASCSVPADIGKLFIYLYKMSGRTPSSVRRDAALHGLLLGSGSKHTAHYACLHPAWMQILRKRAGMVYHDENAAKKSKHRNRRVSFAPDEELETRHLFIKAGSMNDAFMSHTFPVTCVSQP